MHYGIYIGITKFNFLNVLTGGVIAFSFAILISTYAQTNSKQGINTVSIIMLIILTGLSEHLKLSPLILGFLTGLFLSNFHYSAVFINIYSSFERFFYLFCYIFTGIFILKKIPNNFNFYLSAITVIFILFLIRKKLLGKIFHMQIPIKEKYVNLISIGILPAVIIMDYSIVVNLKNISKFLGMFLNCSIF